MNELIPTLPITAWEIKTVPALDMLLINFSYLSHAMQKPEEAVTDRTYVIHTSTADQLARQILDTLAQMKNAPAQGTGIPKH